MFCHNTCCLVVVIVIGTFITLAIINLFNRVAGEHQSSGKVKDHMTNHLLQVFVAKKVTFVEDPKAIAEGVCLDIFEGGVDFLF